MPRSQQPARIGNRAVIAFDLGGTKLAGCLFMSSGKPLVQRDVPLAGSEGSAVGRLIAGEVRRLKRIAERRGVSLRGLGICVPGISHRRTGRVWAPNIVGWNDYPLRAELTAALNEPQAKVVVESDRSASILGETWLGAARDFRHAIFLAVGTGIGAGILTDGRVLRGAHDIAGAVGWLALDRPYRKQYVQRGCFECHASGQGIAACASALATRQRNYRGPLRKSDITAHDVLAAYDRGDIVAKRVLDDAVQYWGMAAANLISIFNPEVVVFGGGVFGPASRFLDDIAEVARRWAQPIAVEHVRFAPSMLGGQAALYGAAYVALRCARLLH